MKLKINHYLKKKLVFIEQVDDKILETIESICQT